MFDQFSKWVQWADSTGLLTFLATGLLAGYKLLHPLIQAKIKTERNRQKLAALEIADNLAKVILPKLVQMSELAPAQRKTAAIQFIDQQLKSLGLSLTEDTIAAKVEKAHYDYNQKAAP
ncbi:hypothetical protein OQI89_15530 [Lentilactobacillus diolivorans]|uniref:hypothetical protein n=1 Tax=Lentilactobacillus TaxID=2767893 RepID=UPI00080BF0FC|nr:MULTISPECIES: hypothetical protein [Lentilactobacillus]MBW0224000.1 hypothetical protein [Lentilactobacillus parabuchneri]MDH5107234.1 hypothetical protein [Lentilactobacillus diolivorans]OCB80518.1 hypothetical protein A7322_12495 [Lentilactobacillus parabuchneri]WOL75495.1 hypothetical protein [Lentilactobacillus parabuchneri]